MKLDALLSTIILVTFLITVIMAVGSYFAYKLRERRRPRASAQLAASPAIFQIVDADEIARLSENLGA
jgi:hypothetical protein